MLRIVLCALTILFIFQADAIGGTSTKRHWWYCSFPAEPPGKKRTMFYSGIFFEKESSRSRIYKYFKRHIKRNHKRFYPYYTGLNDVDGCYRWKTERKAKDHRNDSIYDNERYGWRVKETHWVY